MQFLIWTEIFHKNDDTLWFNVAPYGFLKSKTMQISTSKTASKDISEKNETKVMYWITFRAIRPQIKCYVCSYDNNDVSKWPKIYI